MSRFYFTYGTDPAYPFQGGWTEIEAPDLCTAGDIFSMAHRNQHEGILNCAFVYTEEKFKATEMYKAEGNYGGKCHERIIFDGYKNKRIVFHRESPDTGCCCAPEFL